MKMSAAIWLNSDTRAAQVTKAEQGRTGRATSYANEGQPVKQQQPVRQRRHVAVEREPSPPASPSSSSDEQGNIEALF